MLLTNVTATSALISLLPLCVRTLRSWMMHTERLTTTQRRVSPRVYKLLLTTHIMTSVGWLGVVLGKLVLAIAASTAASAETREALVVGLNTINAAFAPASTGAIISGVLLSQGTRWGLLRHYWVMAKLVLTVGVFGTAVQLVPRIVGVGADEQTFFGVPWAPAILLLFAALHLVMLAAATVLSVYKPWGKTWLGRRADARLTSGRLPAQQVRLAAIDDLIQ